jgi:hypothetical protein
MATKSEKEKETEGTGKTIGPDGKELAPGTVVPTPQNQELADKGIYQPADQGANAPRTGPEAGILADPEDRDLHEDHRKNLAKFPPVPSERAGAASQAK